MASEADLSEIFFDGSIEHPNSSVDIWNFFFVNKVVRSVTNPEEVRKFNNLQCLVSECLPNTMGDYWQYVRRRSKGTNLSINLSTSASPSLQSGNEELRSAYRSRDFSRMDDLYGKVLETILNIHNSSYREMEGDFEKGPLMPPEDFIDLDSSVEYDLISTEGIGDIGLKYYTFRDSRGDQESFWDLNSETLPYLGRNLH